MAGNHDVVVHITGQNDLGGTLNEVTSQLNGLGGRIANTFNDVATSLSGVSTLMTGLFSTVGLVEAAFASLSGVINFGKSAFIDYNAQMETTKIALTTLLGNADDAEAMFRTLHRLAANTPFEFPGLADAGKRLVAMGFSAQGAQKALEASANAAAALGKGQEGIDRIGLALGQTSVKAKASAEEMMQLAEVGVNPYEILQEKLGLTADQAANLGNQNISGKKVAEALVEGMQEKFAGSSKALSDSFTGMIATIEDDVAYIFGDIGESLFEAVKEPVGKVRDFLSDMVNSINDQGLGATLKDMLGAEVINGALMVWETLKQVVVGVVEVLWSAASAGMKVISSLSGLITSVDGIKTAFGEGSGLITAFSAALAALRTTCDVLAETWVWLGDILNNELMYAANEINTAFNELADFISSNLTPVFEGISTIIDTVAETLTWLGDIISNELEYAVNEISNTFGELASTVADTLAPVFKVIGVVVIGVVAAFAGLFLLLKSGCEIIADEVMPVLEDVGDFLQNKLTEAAHDISTAFDELVDMVSDEVTPIFEGIGEVLDTTVEALTGFGEAIGELITNIGEVLDAIIEAFSGFGDAVLSLLDMAFSGIIDAAISFAGGLYDAIVGGTDDTTSESSSIIGSYIDYFCSAFASLQGSLASIWNSISSTILSKVQWFVDQIFSILRELGGFASGIVNFISDKVSNITTKFQANFNAIKASITDFTKKQSGPQSSGGNGSMWRNDKQTDNNSGGGSGGRSSGGGGRSSGGGASTAEKAAQEAQKWAEKIEKDWEAINKKLSKNTESTYAQAMRTLNEEYEKYSKDIEEAQKRGIDTTQLEATLSDYYQRMREKLTKEADTALNEVRDKTELLRAELNRDFTLKANIQYDENMRKVMEEIEKFRKSSMTDDADHNAALEDVIAVYQNEAEIQATATKISSIFKGTTSELTEKIKEITTAFNYGLTDMSQYVDEQINTYQAYSEKLAAIAEDIKARMAAAEASGDTTAYAAYAELLGDVNNETLEIKQTMADLGEGSLWENFFRGLDSGVEKIKTAKQYMQDLGKDIASNLTSTFQSFFGDVLTGQVQSFGDYCKSFFDSLAKSISNIMGQLMQAWTSKAIMGMFGKLGAGGTGFFGFATGGYVSSIPKYAGGGNTFLVGENGPELVTLNGGNAQITSTHTTQRQMGENSTPNVTINLVNQTGQNATAEASTPKWDGEAWVISVVLNAVSTNKNGMRSLIKGVAAT